MYVCGELRVNYRTRTKRWNTKPRFYRNWGMFQYIIYKYMWCEFQWGYVWPQICDTPAVIICTSKFVLSEHHQLRLHTTGSCFEVRTDAPSMVLLSDMPTQNLVLWKENTFHSLNQFWDVDVGSTGQEISLRILILYQPSSCYLSIYTEVSQMALLPQVLGPECILIYFPSLPCVLYALFVSM
jgi:hypothetical protein